MDNCEQSSCDYGTSSKKEIDTRRKEAFITGVFFAFAGIVAALQAWAYRYYVSADSISYLDRAMGFSPARGGIA